MDYVYKKALDSPFVQAIEETRAALSVEGFGVLTEIDVKATLKQKLGVEYRNYQILGACNPAFAHQALLAEPWIGSMLPCNLIVQEFADGRVEVGAVNPLASMQAVNNPALGEIAEAVRSKLQRVIDSL